MFGVVGQDVGDDDSSGGMNPSKDMEFAAAGDDMETAAAEMPRIPTIVVSDGSAPVDAAPESRPQPDATATQTTQQRRGTFHRRNSKDVVDEYFGERRRRSSCFSREATFRFLRQQSVSAAADGGCGCGGGGGDASSTTSDDGGGDAADAHDGGRLATSSSMSSIPEEDSETDVMMRLSERRVSRLATSRSMSIDGFDAYEERDRHQITQALLFDSTPDLTREENYTRFPSIRSQRRGAICFELDESLILLDNFHF